MSYSASTIASAARHIFFPVTTFPPQIEIQWHRSQVGPDFSRPCESCKGTYRSQDVSLSSCTFYTTFDPRELKSFLGKKSCTHKLMGFGHFPVLRTTESPSSWSKTVHVFRTCTTLCLYSVHHYSFPSQLLHRFEIPSQWITHRATFQFPPWSRHNCWICKASSGR